MDAPARYHGHDVLHFLLEAPGPMSPEEIEAKVRANFGASARFHTCSAEGMDVPTLLTFLVQRGKLVEQGGGWVVAGHRICQH